MRLGCVRFLATQGRAIDFQEPEQRSREPVHRYTPCSHISQSLTQFLKIACARCDEGAGNTVNLLVRVNYII